MKLHFVNLLLMLFFSTMKTIFAQESYNNCSNALELCPNKKENLNNTNANSTVCGGCEDDFPACFVQTSSIWVKFTTNAVGGTVSLNFSNLNFLIGATRGFELQVKVLQAGLPCNSASYTAVAGACNTGFSGNTSITCTALVPFTTYYVLINGAKNGLALPASCAFDIEAVGIGIARPVPLASIGIIPAVICANEVTTFAAYLSNCPDSSLYVWKLNGVIVATSNSPYFESSTIQTGDVITFSTTCHSSDCPATVVGTTFQPSLTVQSFAVSAGPDFNLLEGESIILQGATSATQYSWGPTTGLNFTDSLQPIANPSVTTTYYLTATDGTCSQTDEMTIFVNPQLLIPNLFSPNGDSNNDTWEITNITSFPDAEVSVYDRWGQLVFTAVGYNFTKAWDGTRKGKPLPEGVYFYNLNLNTNKADEVRTGYVTLVR
jgi:gliding motility-associated-like protein